MGQHLVLAGVRFAYGQEQFEESLACRRALSYRFLRDRKGWRVFVSTQASPVKRITDRRLGAIGLDLNPNQLVLAELDRTVAVTSRAANTFPALLTARGESAPRPWSAMP